MSAPAAAPKQKKAAKPKKPAAHPKYQDMIVKAISSLKERGGSSRQAILKYIMANFNVGKDANAVNSRLKMALKRGVAKGGLKQAKGQGASGSFRVGEKAAKKPAKKAVKPKKPKTPKKAKAKKPAGEKKVAKPKKTKTPKKAKSPKKAKAAKSPKKPKAAKPKKAAASKAKKAKSPKKGAKKAAKK